MKLVVPYAAGGVGDVTARLVAQKMSQDLGQAVVIENKPGAGLTPVMEYVETKGASTPELFLGRVIEEFGSNRIAWGFNFQASDGTLLEMVKESEKALIFLKPRDVENILTNTALDLYPALK
ncbi:MAG: hypothetical protein ACKVPZ_05425 [Burkholderiaceae bacterium]